eukprot:516502_1
MLSSCLILIALTSVHGRTRKEQFASEFGPHESVTFELNRFVSDNQLEFDLSGEHYKIQLIPSDAVASSCHYFGRVLEPPQTGTTPSYLSLSLCSNEGIRGHITVPSNNERLIIYPAQFVEDPQYDREVGTYQLTDPHLVYKEAWSSHPYPPHTPNDHDDSSRHLLGRYTQNEVELYVLSDPAWTQWFKDAHGSSYYSKLISYMQDVMNSVSAEFSWWNWGNAGKIKVAMVELEIAGEFSGTYASLQPKFNSPASYCRGSYDWRKFNKKGCKIDGVKLLRAFGTWQAQKRKYGDTHLIISGLDFQKAGWGTQGTMCKKQSVAAVDGNGGPYSDYSLRIKTIAHEIGHNFNCPHYSGKGVMGQPKWQNDPNRQLSYLKDEYGDYEVRKSGWSSQSVQALNAYFRAQGGLSCLGNGIRRFTTKNNAMEGETEDDDTYAVAMDGNLDCLKDNEYGDGICIYNYDNTFLHQLSFVLSSKACLNGKPIYEYIDTVNDLSYHLFYNEYEEYVDSVDISTEWAISMDGVDPDDIAASCSELDLTECVQNKWQVRVISNDTMETEESPTMSVTDGYCAGYAGVLTNDSTDSEVTVLYVVIGLLAAVILVGFVCFMYQSQSKKKDVSVMIRDESADEEEEVEVIAVKTGLNTST